MKKCILFITKVDLAPQILPWLCRSNSKPTTRMLLLFDRKMLCYRFHSQPKYSWWDPDASECNSWEIDESRDFLIQSTFPFHSKLPWKFPQEVKCVWSKYTGPSHKYCSQWTQKLSPASEQWDRKCNQRDFSLGTRRSGFRRTTPSFLEPKWNRQDKPQRASGSKWILWWRFSPHMLAWQNSLPELWDDQILHVRSSGRRFVQNQWLKPSFFHVS